MEAEDALKDLLHEIAQQETAIAVARPSSGSIGAGGEKHAQGKEQQRQREDDVADGDGEEDANEDENDEDFADSEFGSRNVSPETVRLSLALQKDWWRSLPDLAYVVTKINQYGKRQTRTIRLTAEGIENVRKNGKVSSLYPYDAVVRVYMKNVKTFVVDYQSAKHSYQYRSIVAMHIVQEITSRLALRRKEDRLLTPDIATRLQEKLQKTGALLREPTLTKPIGSSGTSRRQRTTTVLPGEDRRSQQAKKLLNILGTTEQQRLENAVDWMILDEHTPEGRTLKQFCNNFAVLEKNPATLVMNVRQFMDDMRAYIIERHADELAKLTVEAASQSMLLEELSLSSVVESSLERALVARFRGRIVACLKKPNKEAEMHLKRKIAAASTKPQQFFGVAEEYVVASEWAQAIAELQALDDWDLPCKLLSAILAAAKSIYATLNYEKNRGKGEQKKAIFLSADDFFPIFLFVVTRANLKNPLLVSEYLWGLCDPEQLNGEGGYYLTVFCSAFEYLKTLEMDTESECQQREEEAIKYLDDQILQKRKSSGTTSDQQQSPKAEINSSTSVDSYFSAKKDGGLTAAEDRRQRTTSSPDNGAKSKNLIRQRTESRSDCYEARRVVIGLSGCRTAQEVADEREKTREMVKEMKKEKEEPPQQQHGGSGCAWPTAAVRQRTATLRAEQTAGGGGTGGSGDEVDDDDDGEEEATGSQRARRRASKLDRARVQEAIARYDVSQKED